MANIYVRSTDGNNADNGSTWALAKADLTGAAAIDAAGDTIYLSQAHSESTASALTFNLAGTTTSPTYLIGGNDGAEPPTSLSSSPLITTTGANSIAFNGSVYTYGLKINCGTGSSATTISLNATGGNNTYWDTCEFSLVSTSGSSQIVTSQGSSGSNNKTIWKNCNIKFAATGQKINPGRGLFIWDGGSILSGTSSPVTLIDSAGTSARSEVYISGVNLANAGSSMDIFRGDGGGGRYVIRNSKLPASWSGSLLTGTIVIGLRAEMHNCDSGDTNYRLWAQDLMGTIKSETTLVKTNGASDGTTTFSWKMVSSTTAEYPSLLLESPELSIWNNTTGSSITVTVDILTDSATNLKDDEIWLELQYLGTSGFPLSTWINDSKSGILSTAADQTASSATWTTTGMSNPNKQKLSVSFTPQEKGYIQARVILAKASTTVYVDPLLQVS